MEKGLVCADSFLPVRQWLDPEKAKKMSVRQLAGISRPPEARHSRPLHFRNLIACRETVAACGLSWQDALSVLRIWEYTGQARRGYFVEGLSGAQFIRGSDYQAVVRLLL